MTALLFIVLLLQTVPRDKPAAPPDRATAVLGGRVTDKETGEPLGGVTVMLRVMGGSAREEGRSVRTGDDGRYQFRQVPAGSYAVGADLGEQRPTHLLQLYGDPSFTSAYGPPPRPKPIDVRDGDVRDDLHIAMSRALAIGGTVVNDAGEPLANIPVQARAIVRGRIVSGGPARATDDRGAFRLFGLPPGRYLFCTPLSTYGSGFHTRPDRLVPTCYPSAIREEDAGVVVLKGGDVPDVQIRMQQLRTVRLTGTVLDSTGAPAARATVNIESRDRLARFSENVGVRNGQLTVEGLLPGEYRLLAHALGSDPNEFHQGELGTMNVTLDAVGLDGIVITMAKAAKVAGHVLFEDDAVPAMTEPLTVRSLLAPGLSPRPVRVREDLTFVLEGLFGAQLLDIVNVPKGWILKSVRHNGVDVTDTPVAFASSGDTRALQIALTRRSATVSGRVLDDKGQPVAAARVFLFPADPERRRRGVSGDSSSGADGAFAIQALRAGEYLIVAVHQDEAPELDDRPDFDILARAAERVSLYEGETRAMTLRLAKLHESR
jgi:hypothetical protein